MSSYQTKKTPGDTAWFTHDRFGMFIHWGLYAMPARHEWIKTRERMTDESYDRYFRQAVGQAGQGGRNEICRHDGKAPRGLLHVRLPVHRL